MKQFFALLILIAFACNRSENDAEIPSVLDFIVVVSIDAPFEKYNHYLLNDSLGKLTNTSGIYQPVFNTYEYMDKDNLIRKWTPKVNTKDTLILEWSLPYFELSTDMPFTAEKLSFLIQKGDTLLLKYENNIPVATIKNRVVNDTILNYNKYRLKELFSNSYSSHYLVFAGIFFDPLYGAFDDENQIKNYQRAKDDFQNELQLLRTLPMSSVDFNYRRDALSVVMQNHQRIPAIAEWEKIHRLGNQELVENELIFDLSKADSLIQFQSFREFLKMMASYDVPRLTKTYPGGGAFRPDSRARFDSIALDARFNHGAKNYLLASVYQDILNDFSVEDKAKYFEKLEMLSTNQFMVEQVKIDHNLTFLNSSHLKLLTVNNQQTSFKEVIESNLGKWIYVDFWASWCKPCIEQKAHLAQLENDLKNEEITFIHIALNDKKAQWEKFMSDERHKGNHFFALNGNTSIIPEELSIQALPHYLIYNPRGERAIDFANRPSKDAKSQIKTLMAKYK